MLINKYPEKKIAAPYLLAMTTSIFSSVPLCLCGEIFYLFGENRKCQN